jgi:flagellar basal-body rod protein FlgB
MFDVSGMMSTNYILEKSMDVESLRRKVIADNISNVDVPHFKRSEVNFESELKRAINQNSYVNENRLPAIMTDNKHIPFFIDRDIKSVSPRINLDYTTSMRNDGNNVDIEKEMVDSSKNTMRYNALVSSLNHNYKMLKAVIRAV